jgi:hypothetical protein
MLHDTSAGFLMGIKPSNNTYAVSSTNYKPLMSFLTGTITPTLLSLHFLLPSFDPTS